MRSIKSYILNMTKKQKIYHLIALISFCLLLTIFLPSLARIRSGNISNTISTWDGTIATKYNKGTGSEDDPYIITNGSELAYLYSSISDNEGYENVYFKLDKDIVLNKGKFIYNNEDGIMYKLDDVNYYVDSYTDKYYSSKSMNGSEVGKVNLFNSIDNFKGHFDGNSHSIYGLYLSSSEKQKLALFTDLQGEVNNLYVENSLIYGGSITAGIASDAKDSNITNTLFDGYVIGKNFDLEQVLEKSISDISIDLSNVETEMPIDLSDVLPLGAEIVNTSLTGSLELSNTTEYETQIKINENIINVGSFSVSLGKSILSSISLKSLSYSADATANLTNLKYVITYKYALAGGLVGEANNVTITNSINKGYVYGHLNSAGLVGSAIKSININQSYNNGVIISDELGGGLVGKVSLLNSESSITRAYNTGNVTSTYSGSLIGNIENNNDNILNIIKVFNTSSNNYAINSINSSVNIQQLYSTVGSLESTNSSIYASEFNLVTLEQLYNKEFMTNSEYPNLMYGEYVDSNDLNNFPENVWSYTNSSLPVLYIDDVVNQLAMLYAGSYSWESLSNDLSFIRFDSNFAFSVEENREINKINEIYYYISNSMMPLTINELSTITEWTLYENIVSISNDGVYVLYAKIIDIYGNISYINSDILVINKEGTIIDMSLNEETWNNYSNNLNSVYIGKEEKINISATAGVLSVSSIKYYVTNEEKTLTEIKNLEEDKWINYTDGVLINSLGKSIVYTKVIDNTDYVAYANTDYIIYDGYSISSMTMGRNGIDNQNNVNISSNSIIKYKFDYNSEENYKDGYIHNLVSNVLLPTNTKITLLDKIDNKIYQYTTSDEDYGYNGDCLNDSSCVATYPFTLFSEIGRGDNRYFEEYSSLRQINEEYQVIIDFKETSIDEQLNNVTVYPEIRKDNNIIVRPTLDQTKKYFNVQPNSSILSIETTSTAEIILNSTSINNINITGSLINNSINDQIINDTTIEDKQIGLRITMVNSLGNIVSKDSYKNMMFKIGDTYYYPESDNVVRINLNNGLNNINTTLSIETEADNIKIAPGLYYINITPYVSYDGIYDGKVSSNSINIPVIVSNGDINMNYGFDVIMEDNNRVIQKNTSVVTIPFKIIQYGEFANPSVRVTLSRKSQLTAYNQDYSSIDMNEYISSPLNRINGNEFMAVQSPIKYNGTVASYNNFSIDIETLKLEKNGYKFSFDLYDGTTKIGTIEKKFIIK